MPALAKVPAEPSPSRPAPWWKAAVDWVTVNFFDAIEFFRTGFLLYVLNPLRAFFEGLPWLGVVRLLGLCRLSARRLCGLRSSWRCSRSFCAATGLWVADHGDGLSVRRRGLHRGDHRHPDRRARSRSDRRLASIVTPIIDTLQTIPSFCFIIPVVMLFRVGDVTALIATVAFAIVPAIRYTNHGIRQVPHELIEAGVVSGCTKRQLFWRVQLPVAMPEIMLGINQTILLALSMIIICAMIGTRDLGQEVFKALSKADAGKGIVAGPRHRLHRHHRRPADHRLGGAAADGEGLAPLHQRRGSHRFRGCASSGSPPGRSREALALRLGPDVEPGEQAGDGGLGGTAGAVAAFESDAEPGMGDGGAEHAFRPGLDEGAGHRVHQIGAEAPRAGHHERIGACIAAMMRRPAAARAALTPSPEAKR